MFLGRSFFGSGVELGFVGAGIFGICGLCFFKFFLRFCRWMWSCFVRFWLGFLGSRVRNSRLFRFFFVFLFVLVVY